MPGLRLAVSRKKHRHHAAEPAAANQDSARSQGTPHASRAALIGVLAIGTAVIAGLLWWWTRADFNSVPAQAARSEVASVPPTERAQYVDEQQCVACHGAQARSWQGSHHDLAMQEATAATVLGDF